MDEDEGGSFETEKHIHQKLMMNKMGRVLQLHPTHLILPNGVDGLGRCVIIHYINSTKGGQIDQQIY